jgi:hypothetical protein
MPPQYSKIAERLLVHAGLCREMATATTDSAMARKLLQMAEDCVGAAAEDWAAARSNKPTAAQPVPKWNFGLNSNT